MTGDLGESAQERRARYLRLSREAKELAGKSKTLSMREACLAMAQSWLTLASEIAPATEPSAPGFAVRSKEQSAIPRAADD
jgi:hypothetical protein